MDEVSMAKEMGRINADISHIKKDLGEINAKMDKIVGIESRLSTLETKMIDTGQVVKKVEEAQSRVIWLVIATVIGAILKIVILDGGIKK